MPPGLDVALSHILTPEGIALFLGAVVLGTAAAVLPGISVGTLSVLFLPLSFVLDKYVAFMVLATLVGTGGFAGSMTAILLNVPGEVMNAPTCLDGHPLARQGKAGVAIGASATSSAIGTVFGVGVVALALPLLAAVFLRIGPPEFFALSVAAIVLIATVFTGSPVKGLVSGLIGALMGFIGVDPATAEVRYTFGRLELYDGIAIAPALIGLFAIPELFDLMTRNASISGDHPPIHGVWEGLRETLRRPFVLLRSALLGVLTGLIPGVGQNLASWLSYFIAVRTSKEPETFGKGNIDGVIAPEATIDVKETSTMAALFVFGIPSGISSVIFLAEFQVFGVVPGAALLERDQPLIWVIIGAIAVTSLLTSALAFVFAGPMVRITTVPVALLMPFIYVLGVVGATIDQGSLFGVVLVIAFGLLGIAMDRFGYPRAPLLVGLVLIPFAEHSFQLSLALSRNTYAFVERPLTLAILATVAAALIFTVVSGARRRRAAAATRTSEPAQTSPSLGEAAFALFLSAIVVAFLYESFFVERHEQRLAIAAQLVLAASLAWILWSNLARWLRARPAHGVRWRPDPRSPAVRSLGWILAFPALLALGFVTASCLYTAAFATGFAPAELDRRRAVIAIVLTAAMGALLYGVLIRTLHLRLYQGLFI